MSATRPETATPDGVILSAYNAAPVGPPDDERERLWYATLASRPTLAGLELSATPGLHHGGAKALGGLLPPRWRCSVSTVQLTLTQTRIDSRYGLASVSDEHRARAVADIATLRQHIDDLHQHTGVAHIADLQLLSAPSRPSSVAALLDSLERIVAMDWGSLALSIEHVDSASGPRPAKGYLELADELRCAAEIAERTGVRVGTVINWGRSTLEGQSIGTPLAHLRAAVETGTLRRLVFSGISPEATDRTSPWQDAHLPAAPFEPGSLLDCAAVREALLAAGPVALGVKVMNADAAETPDGALRAADHLTALLIEERAAIRSALPA